METLRDRLFTGASSAMNCPSLPEKPHRQLRAVLQTASYLPIRPLRATTLQRKDLVHLLLAEISQRHFPTSPRPTAVHFNSLGRSEASAPAQTSEGLTVPTSVPPGTCCCGTLALPATGPMPGFVAFWSSTQGSVIYS